jgi:soluble lytic murein transglycosylase-like protein
MRILAPFVIFLTAAALGVAADEPRPADSKPAVTDPKEAVAAAVARKLQAVAAMQSALAGQRLSISKQVGQASPDSFFLLKPPSPPAENPGMSAEMDCPPLPDSEVDALVESAAKREDLEPNLLRGIAKQESGFRPCAVSSKGAMGLMQLMPATAVELGVKDPFDPKENVDAGARLFKQLLTSFGDLTLALGAYNAGPSKVNDANGLPNIPETLNYVQKILSGSPLKP